MSEELSELERGVLDKLAEPIATTVVEDVKDSGFTLGNIRVYLEDLSVREQGAVGKLVSKKLVVIGKDTMKRKYIEKI